MDTRMDAILRRVAAGELSPDDALAEIDREQLAPAPVAPGAPVTARRNGRPLPYDEAREHDIWQTLPTSLTVRTSYRSIEIVGDPTVGEIHVHGAHVLRRTGDALVLDNPDFDRNDVPPGRPGPRTEPGNKYSFTNVPWGRRARAWRDDELVVRINPALFVDIDVSGCNVRADGLRSGLRARVLASKLQVDELSGSFDLHAFSSSVKGSLLPTGMSTINCESSSVKVQLSPAADLRISVRNRMGKVMLPNVYSKGGIADPDLTETVIGAGRNSLTIDAMMSSVMMSVAS